eukprot:1762069-Ditylum_brightwellii.AAC.1
MATKYTHKVGGLTLGIKLSLFVDAIMVLVILFCGPITTLGAKISAQTVSLESILSRVISGCILMVSTWVMMQILVLVFPSDTTYNKKE